MEGEWIGYVYLINGTLSMICGVLLLLLYTFTKSFRQSPGMLIFWHIFSQTFIDTFFAITGFYKVVTKTFPDYMCPILGAFNTYFYLIGFNYSLCLCTEVIKRLQNPMENSYYKRGKVYHIASHSLGIVIALIIFFQKEAGASSNHFCLIKQESIYIYIIALPLVMFTPTLAFTLYIMCKMKAGTSSISFFLVKHSVYITIYFSIWCPVIVNLLLRKDVYESDRNMLSRTSVIACSSSGWVLCMVRLGSYFLIRLLKKSDRSKSKCNSSITKLINESIKDFPDANFLEDSINYKSDYVNAFSSVSTESALTSIIILQLSLQYSSELIDSKPPWDKCLYKEQTKYKVSQKKLKLLRLPKNLRKYCNK